MSSSATAQDQPVKSLIPARMHDMPWSRFHWMVIFGLGTAWILDGLEIQIVAAGGFEGSLGHERRPGRPGRHRLPHRPGGRRAAVRPAHRHPRPQEDVHPRPWRSTCRRGPRGLAPNMVFLLCRFISGMGIGGEYSAINSAIDELIPGKYRGRVDLAINGTYWAGAALGAVASSILLDTDRFAENIGWRIAFFIGPVLGLGHHLPAPAHPGEPPLDGHPRPRRGGGEDRRSGSSRRSATPGGSCPEHDDSESRWIKAGPG